MSRNRRRRDRGQGQPAAAAPVGAQPAPNRPRWLGWNGWALVAGLAAALLIYRPALDAGFIWDDDDYVTANPALRSLSGLGDIWLRLGATAQYYPLTFTTFWLEFHAWKDWAAGYHAVNVSLHALNAALLWQVLRRLAAPGAWIAGLLFLVHPVAVESVAWITERKNVLSTCCYLAAACCYLRWQDAPAEPAPKSAGWGWYVLTVLLFAGALLAKTVTCSLPAALLLATYWRTGRLTRRDLLATAPLFALGAALAFVTVHMERQYVGATGADWSLSPLQRLLIAGNAVWFYLSKLVWPFDLVFMYPRWDLDLANWRLYLLPISALALVAALWLGRKVGRGPLVAALFFGGTLLPALGLFDVYPMRYTFVADHYQYLACVGPLTLAGAALAKLPEWIARRWPAAAPRWTGDRRSLALVAAVAPLAVGLAVLSNRQTRIYHDPVTLWSDTIARNPTCWMAYNNLGVSLAAGGAALSPQRQAEVARMFQTALEQNPNSPECLNSAAGIALDQHRWADAADYSRRALERAPDVPETLCNLGTALLNLGDLMQAEQRLRDALRLRPDFPTAHANLGNVLAQSGRAPEAIEEFRAALRSKPSYYIARQNLALALTNQGQLAAALAEYRRALDEQPNSAEGHFQLGNLYIKLGRASDAQNEWRTTVRLDPRQSNAWNNLGGMLLQQNSATAAIEHFQQALAADPNNASALQNLELARQMLSQ